MGSGAASLELGAAVAALRARLRGDVVRPGDRDYEAARSIWNGMTARQPSLIARVDDAADVIACVNFARDLDLPLSIRGGGHNVAGTALCDGGVTIDMSGRRAVRVDPARSMVQVDAGATWGDVDQESLKFGLVVPSGVVSKTGVAGLTMGGGFGWTSRKFGFSADNLASCDIVTGDGKLQRASATENPDLFWAVRGGGGNFGVVTSFQFDAHRLQPNLLCGLVVYPLEQIRAVAACLREVCAQAPDELTCLLILRHAPPAPYLPAEVHGRPIAAIAACWTGDPGAGAHAMRPLRTLGQPLADTIELKPFVEHQTMLDASQPFGRRYYWKSHFCHEISTGLAEALAAHTQVLPSPHCSVLLMQLGGRAGRLDPGTNAVGLREAPYALNIQAAWEQGGDDALNIEWALAFWKSVIPFSTGGVYVNFMTQDESEARLRAAYGEPAYARLRQIKTRWDPGNLFHGAQNIAPLQAAQ